MDKENTPILFLHISKAAGSSVKYALRESFSELSFCDEIFEATIRKDKTLHNYQLYASHVGFDTAKSLGAEVITILRDPFERITSLYNFWHNRSPQVDHAGVFEAVSKMTVVDFLTCQDMRIIVDRDNCQTYQLASSHNKFGRDKLKTFKDIDILDLALENLSKCKVVGFVEHLSYFSNKFSEVYSREINIPQINISKRTDNQFLLNSEIRHKAIDSVYLDQMLYSEAIKHFL